MDNVQLATEFDIQNDSSVQFMLMDEWQNIERERKIETSVWCAAIHSIFRWRYMMYGY